VNEESYKEKFKIPFYINKVKRGVLMSKKYIFVLLFLAAIFVFIKSSDRIYDEIIVIKPNTVGNNTNNIAQGMPISSQDNFIYYGGEDLYRIEENSGELFKLDSGYAYSINVIGEWVYYIKPNEVHEHDKGRVVVYPNLYKIKINGSSKTRVLENVIDVNIRNNKLFYITYYEIIGNRIDKDERMNLSALVTSNLDGSKKEVLVPSGVESIVMDDDNIYYRKDDKLFVYNLKDATDELLLDYIDRSYILYNGNIISFNKEAKQFKSFNLDTKKENILLEDIEGSDVETMYVTKDKLYYIDDRYKMFEYDINKKVQRKIERQGSDVWFCNDKIYEVFRDNTIKELKS